jgi:hypothetical protein
MRILKIPCLVAGTHSRSFAARNVYKNNSLSRVFSTATSTNDEASTVRSRRALFYGKIPARKYL